MLADGGIDPAVFNKMIVSTIQGDIIHMFDHGDCGNSMDSLVEPDVNKKARKKKPKPIPIDVPSKLFKICKKLNRNQR